MTMKQAAKRIGIWPAASVLLAGLAILILRAGCAQPQPPKPPPSGKPIDPARFCACVMGYGDKSYSGGLQFLVGDLRDAGVDARLYRWVDWRQAAADSVAATDITLVVHSWGGDFAARYAAAIAPRKIRLVFGMEPTAPGDTPGGFPVANPPPKPPNVASYVEFYCVPQTPFTEQKGPRVDGSEAYAYTKAIHTRLDDEVSLRQLAEDAVLSGR